MGEGDPLGAELGELAAKLELLAGARDLYLAGVWDLAALEFALETIGQWLDASEERAAALVAPWHELADRVEAEEARRQVLRARGVRLPTERRPRKPKGSHGSRRAREGKT